MKRVVSAGTILGLIVSLMLCTPWVRAAEEFSRAAVMDVKGEAMMMKAGSPAWMPLASGSVMKEGDAIKTGASSEVTLELSGAHKVAELTVRENSLFTFEALRHNETAKSDTTLLNVEIGNVLVKAEKLTDASKFEVKTPTSIVGIRGTIFEVQVSKT